jgi:hypothetical protein
MANTMQRLSGMPVTIPDDHGLRLNAHDDYHDTLMTAIAQNKGNRDEHRARGRIRDYREGMY